MMKQVFIFGSSLVYWVWSTFGGWAWLMKSKFHDMMFASWGVWEEFEVFNFGKSWATMDFVKDHYKYMLNHYKRDGHTIALINVWWNNMKAENTPDNYVSSPEEFEKELQELLKEIKKDFDEVLFVGSWCIDESKTNPKPNPLTWGCSYFTNERKDLFDKIIQDICEELHIEYIGIDMSKEDWIKDCLYKDGLHANDNGYTYVFHKIWSKIKAIEGFLD